MSITTDACRKCEYVCKCCSARDNGFEACMECSKDYDKFIPARQIRHCPQSGEVVQSYLTTHCIVMGHGVDERKRVQDALEKYFKNHGELRL